MLSLSFRSRLPTFLGLLWPHFMQYYTEGSNKKSDFLKILFFIQFWYHNFVHKILILTPSSSPKSGKIVCYSSPKSSKSVYCSSPKSEKTVYDSSAKSEKTVYDSSPKSEKTPIKIFRSRRGVTPIPPPVAPSLSGWVYNIEERERRQHHTT